MFMALTTQLSMSASGFKNQCSRPRFEPVLLASDDACNLQVSDA